MAIVFSIRKRTDKRGHTVTRQIVILVSCLLLITTLGLSPAMAAGAKDTRAQEPSELFWRAIEEARWGEREAQYTVGMMYLKGEGVEKDEKEGAGWMLKAAEQDHPYGIYKMGELYEKGIGVAKDPSLSAEWYKRAAKTGMGDPDEKAYYQQLRQAEIAAMKQRLDQEQLEEQQKWDAQMAREQRRHEERLESKKYRYYYQYDDRRYHHDHWDD